MELRTLGRTGIPVSLLGYGAGAVGGLMVRGTPAEQERSIARALEAGITYFDTASAYGNGQSETNLGRVLKSLKAEVVLGTKVRVAPDQWGDLPGTIAASLDASLTRLGRDHVDLYQLHNNISVDGGPGVYSVRQVLEEAVPALRKLVEAGKTRAIGITAIGEIAALRQLVDSHAFDTAQLPYNLLNPSAFGDMPPLLPGQDYDELMLEMSAAGMGVIGIRILAGGALSGEADRHPIAMPEVAPIASAADYAADLANARRLQPIIAEGHADSLADAAIRFAIAPPPISTVLIGTASLDQLEAAIAAVAKGPLSIPALDRIGELQA